MNDLAKNKKPELRLTPETSSFGYIARVTNIPKDSSVALISWNSKADIELTAPVANVGDLKSVLAILENITTNLSKAIEDYSDDAPVYPVDKRPSKGTTDKDDPTAT